MSEKKQKYRIMWKIGNACGHGDPVSQDVAEACAGLLNLRYGLGTHWASKEE